MEYSYDHINLSKWHTLRFLSPPVPPYPAAVGVKRFNNSFMQDTPLKSLAVEHGDASRVGNTQYHTLHLVRVGASVQASIEYNVNVPLLFQIHMTPNTQGTPAWEYI